jgi:multiple sugar transport system ATP-binding protein
MAQIRVENLRKSFDQFTAVHDSNFTIENGSFFALLGPSGCGKTTTLRMIAGLELPTDGRILLDGEDVTFRRAAARDIAFVFQLFALYPHMNVAQNIGFPLKCQGMPRREARERVTETARLLRIEHLLSSKTSKLSGGDRQRVALGRAMVRRPKAFLMDEPLGALDAEFRQLMCGELRELHDRISATTIYVTHDQHEAMSMADRIAVMNAGRVEQIGSPQEIYDRPASMFVADFIGSPPMNFLQFESRPSVGRPCRQVPRRQHCRARDPRGACRGTAGVGRASRAHSLLGRCAGARPRLWRRVPWHDADRHRRHRTGASQGAPCRRAFRCRSARPSVSHSGPIGLALFDAQSGSAIRTASHGSAAHG